MESDQNEKDVVEHGDVCREYRCDHKDGRHAEDETSLVGSEFEDDVVDDFEEGEHYEKFDDHIQRDTDDVLTSDDARNTYDNIIRESSRVDFHSESEHNKLGLQHDPNDQHVQSNMINRHQNGMEDEISNKIISNHRKGTWHEPDNVELSPDKLEVSFLSDKQNRIN